MKAAAPKNIATKPAEGGAMRAAAARKAMTTQAMMTQAPQAMATLPPMSPRSCVSSHPCESLILSTV